MYLNRPFLGWLLLLGAMAWGATQPPFGGAELLVLPLGLLLLDLFRIPRWVRQHNVRVATIAPSPLPAPAPVVAGTPAGAAAQPPFTAAAPPPQKPKDLRTLLLHVAHRGDGKLTVTQAVMETGMDWKPNRALPTEDGERGIRRRGQRARQWRRRLRLSGAGGAAAAARRRAPHGRRSGSRACIDSAPESCIYNFGGRGNCIGTPRARRMDTILQGGWVAHSRNCPTGGKNERPR